jgi:ribonuclease HI
VRNEASDLGLELPVVSLLQESRLGPWDHPPFEVCMALASLLKANTCEEQYLQSFGDHRHVADMEIYTDGSKGEAGVGAGFGKKENLPGNGFSGRRLHAMASVFTAELWAIKLALISLKAYDNRSCVIYSDSRSSLQAIQRPRSPVKLVREISELIAILHDQGVTVSFCWIPSHVGIEGNELADKAAKRAANHGAVYSPEVPESDIKASIKHKVKLKWEQEWHNIADNKKLRLIQPTLKRSVATLGRKDAIKLTRLRIGHSRFTHKFRLNGDDKPECIECMEDITIEHILIGCGNYALERLQFYDPRDTPMSVLLSDEQYVKKVLDFLRLIGLYDEI